MNRTTSRLGAAGAAALLLPALGYAVPAAANGALACGSTVMVSTVLTEDLVCPSGDGLVIGADGVVLDLGGHSITGGGAYVGGVGAGVRIGQRTGVTVMNGEIAHFAAAVEVQQSWAVTVSGIHAGHGDRGINVGTGGGHLIEKNVIHDNGRDAVKLSGPVGVTVAKNAISANVWGISVSGASSATVVSKNVVSGSQRSGIEVWEDSSGTVLDKNVVSANGTDGIAVQVASSGTVLTKNEAYANGDDGIDVDSTSATLTKNLAVGNGDLGIEAVAGVTDGGGNMAAGNGNPLQCTGVVCTAPM